MVGSFKRTLLTIAALTVLVCGAAIAALLFLARTTTDERADHARENVTREVERLRATLELVPRTARPRREQNSGELRSGYLGEPSEGGPDEGSFVVEAAERANARHDAVVVERADAEGTPVLVAAAPVSGGGAVFAFQRVVAGRETRGLRVVVLVLALLAFSLVVASLRTLAAVERGVSSLRGSLAAVAGDLRAPIAHPALRELDEVAVGVEALARELARAQDERDRLTRELGERERLAGLGRVVAGVAHEVRNPLAAMKLRADLARRSGDVTAALASDLEDISSEIARLDRLVSDLLIVAGRRPGQQREVDVGDLVAGRVTLLATWAATRGVVLANEGGARALALMDVDGITRAVDNLLRNAVEASPDGGRVDAIVAVGQSDGVVSVEVVDRGAGVPPERSAELFEPFFTTKPEGTGLGLALARAVASAHRGTLTYTRRDDTTRFTLTVGIDDGGRPEKGKIG